MVLSIGEILADIIVGEDGKIEWHAGGAPFNVAVNCARCGTKTAFIGRVGNDPAGRYVLRKAGGCGLQNADIQIDPKRNTTLAFVSLQNGERDFAFFRRDTADYHIDYDSINFYSYGKPDILHLGSLMFSEKDGRSFAKKILLKAKKEKIILSFDVNLRSDLFSGTDEAKKAFRPALEQADILKFSDDEIMCLSGKDNIADAAEVFSKNNRLLFVTMGAKGSICFYNGKSIYEDTEKITPVDTTGAGDAFFGAVLASLSGKSIENLSDKDIGGALRLANRKGAETTLFKGALEI